MSTDRSRHEAIDWLKAASIVTVVFIHSQAWGDQGPFLGALGQVTEFAVPAFLFASGFLFRSRAAIGVRLTRVLVPYLMASGVALGFRVVVLAERFSAGEAARMVLLGSAHGIYYFVPVLLLAILIAAALARVPRLLLPAAAVFLVAGLLNEAGLLPLTEALGLDAFFWEVRNPIRWLGYYLVGHATRNLADRGIGPSPVVRAWLGAAALAGPALSLSLALAEPPGPTGFPGAMVQYASNYGTIAAILLLGSARPVPPGVRWLSGATYPIYLYHIFFVQAVLLTAASPAALPLAVGAGLAGSAALVVVGRKTLGPRARLWIG